MSEQSFLTGHTHGSGFLERLLHGLEDVLSHAEDAARRAEQPGLLQRLDARSKLIGSLCVLLAALTTHDLRALLLLWALPLGCAWGSALPLRRVLQLWLGVLIFTGGIALPALFLVPGPVAWQLAELPPITSTGLHSALRLILRAETSSTTILVLILSTAWPQLLKGLRSLGVPAIAIALLAMTQRYIFVLLQVSQQLLEARRSRILAPLSAHQQRSLVTNSLGAILTRSLSLAQDVHLAMLARGWRGEVRLLRPPRLRGHDFAALVLTVIYTGCLTWIFR